MEKKNRHTLNGSIRSVKNHQNIR